MDETKQEPMHYVVLSCSLNPGSRSRILAKAARDRLEEQGQRVDYVDLVEFPVPFCDGGKAYGDAKAQELKQRLLAADGVLLAVPIYNYDANAAAKNVVELTGRDVWVGKVAGFMCAAGGQGSFMSIMALANSLMLDFRTYIIPRFVYTNAPDFTEDRTAIANDDVANRLDQLVAELLRVTPPLRAGAEVPPKGW